MALDRLLQIGTPLGMWQAGARELEPDGSADGIVGLIGDDGFPYKRGGSTYKSNAALGSTGLLSVASAQLPVGVRTLFQSADGRFGALAADDATPVVLSSTYAGAQPQRAVVVGDALVIPDSATPAFSSLGGVYVYGGSYKTANYSTGTMTTTNGSTAVTGAGTAWLANVDAGMVVLTTTGMGIVSSVDSNTALTLLRPWTGSSGAAVAYALYPIYRLAASFPPIAPAATAELRAARSGPIAAVANRLAYVATLSQARVYFTVPFYLADGVATDYHSFPTAVVGLAGLRDSLFVFTKAGLYVVSNMAFNLVDNIGNPQQRIDLVNADLIAWGHEGIAQWSGALVAPALDGIWLLDGLSAPSRISDPIQDLYLSYVTAGYKPGVAEVFNAHYLLPILDASNVWVDTLICRLRAPRRGEGSAWSQLADSGAQVSAFAERPSSPPLLLGASLKTASRVTGLSSFFSPAAAVKNDADATTPKFQYTTRAFSTGNLVSNYVSKVRARYVLTDAASDNPTVTCEASINGGGWTALSRTSTGTTSPEDDGTNAYAWAVRKRARDIRFRFTVTGPSASMIFRVVEVFLRHSGKY